MRTRPKAILSVLLILFVLFACLAWILSQFLVKNYLQLEQDTARVDVMRIRDALDTRVNDLHTKLGDWAQWDDTYQFIQDHNQAYIDSNLQLPTFDLLHVDIIAITDLQGGVVFSQHVRQGQSVTFSDTLTRLLQTEERFRHLEKTGVKGVLKLPEGMLVFAIRPVISSDGTAPPNGQVIFGHFLDDTDASALATLVHFPVKFYPITDQLYQDPRYQLVLKTLEQSDITIPLVDTQAGIIYGYTDIHDSLSSQPILLIQAELLRTIFIQGRHSVFIFLEMMALAGSIIVVVVISLFEVIVLRKLSRLEQGVVSVRTTPEQYPTVQFPKTNDEFWSLAQEINQSLRSLYTTEARLEEQRNELKKFQLAADKSFNHLIITDANGVVMYANPAATRNTGYTNQEIIGKKPSLWGKQMPKAVYTNMWKTIKEEKNVYVGELTNKRKDGTLYVVEASISPIVDDEGVVQYFVGIERDITEERARQKRDHDHLEELEEFTSKIASEKARAEGILRYLRSIGEGVFATDRHGNIVFVNNKAADMIGKPIDEILGKESIECFEFRKGNLISDKRIYASATALKLMKAHTFPRNIFLFRSNQDPIPVTGSLGPIFEQTHLAGAIVVFQDITERYELEKMKGNFLSIAAHQLRTPLGSMRWSMELLLDGDLGKLPKAAKETIAQLYENSKRMIVLVADLLSVARIDQGESLEKKKLADVGLIWDEVIKTMKPQAEKLGIILTLKKQKTAFPSIMLPTKHIYEAFENLVSNALKYNREHGKVVVTLKEEANGVHITVQDTGIGIPKAVQSKVFSKFFRAQNAIHKETEGSGLGLSVVKSYLEEAGATIRFESQENVGTTFFIKIPFHPVHS